MAEVDTIGIVKRLRAVMAHLGKQTVREFGEEIGADRSAVSNWMNAATSGNPPPVHHMVTLTEKVPGLTLDWIYTGNPDALPMGLGIRLMALAELAQVPEQKPDRVAKARPDRVAHVGNRRRGQPAT